MVDCVAGASTGAAVARADVASNTAKVVCLEGI